MYFSEKQKCRAFTYFQANLIQLAAVPFSEPIRLTTKLIPTTEPLTLPFTTQVPQKIMPETHSVYFVRSFQKEKKYNAIHDHCYGKHVQEKSLGETESAVERKYGIIDRFHLYYHSFLSFIFFFRLIVSRIIHGEYMEKTLKSYK